MCCQPFCCLQLQLCEQRHLRCLGLAQHHLARGMVALLAKPPCQLHCLWATQALCGAPLQEEGIVVKDVTSPWKMNDRGTAWQKIKPGIVVRCLKVHCVRTTVCSIRMRCRLHVC